MPNKRATGKVNVSAWVSDEQKDAIDREMRKLGFSEYSEYLKFKLGFSPRPGEKPVKKK